jgi:GH15 family glucan-1,4-alpha-glucosidase
VTARIEDYALIGDCYTAGLVSRDGSLDWLCLPRFDSGACFAALLGKPEHGRWLLTAREPTRTSRRYRDDTLLLETEHETADGAAVVVDCMPVRTHAPDVVRVVEGKRGSVRMLSELIIRCDYGSIVPWVRRIDGGISAIAGPDRLLFRTTAPLRNQHFKSTCDFVVSAGERVAFHLTWHPSHRPAPDPIDVGQAVADTERWWKQWASQCNYQGEWRGPVMRSLITLKALTYAPTGGIVAAATTSLPEQIGGVRNWDYRICWLRDATFALLALLHCGYHDEARAWRKWLLRAVAGDPAATNILYGLAGERRLPEVELDWLPGYENSRPVRIGNAAYKQFQLDVYGEVADALFQSRRSGLPAEPEGWNVGRALYNFVVQAWERPDEGIWEVRGPRRHFTHSKVMAWVALDRAVKGAETFGQQGSLDRWREVRDRIHHEVCEKGYNPAVGAFVQYFGATDLDASLLMIPLVGFLPPTDPRVRGTVEAIQKHLMEDGFVKRYTPHPEVDGLPPGEGAFLACTFWLADNLMLLGRAGEARQIFERLLGLCNDVGLLAEEYDPHLKRQVGNFPQAFSHVGLVNTALNLSCEECPAGQRPSG